MKKLLVILFVIGASFVSNAQYVRVQVGFPANYHMSPYGARPYSSAIWVGPEWRWRGGRYVAVPGYWARPRQSRAMWVPGYWKQSRRGWYWVPGHWR